MNKSLFLSIKTFGFVLLATLCSVASASVVITGTRVIYPSDAREVSVKLNNTGKRPVLIQSWIDDGDAKAKPETLHVPFVLTPPINRVEPEKGQTLRISYNGQPLPADRESVYWLNVLEIPAKNPLLKDENYLQMAFRSRIKLFFRPVVLKGKANEAAKALVWHTQGQQLTAKNPTPYYISLVGIAVNGKQVEADMIAPFAKASFTLAGKAGEKITVTYVNDYGAVVSFDTQIK
ncbi:fimbrial biogenesis chaperone [Erwinia sp. CGal63]|uniref:fimbrial biogenesis chaperone n=1 Tax=Erwinia sp. CGal63 TaxID=2919889 RepID=UPI00300915E9